MSDLFHHVALKARARTGFSSSVAVWLVMMALSLILALVFLSVAAFIALAARFDGVIAGLILGAVFLLIAGIAALAAWIIRLRNRERAQAELAAQGRPAWLDPSMLLNPSILGAALRVGRTVGWGRILTLAAAGLFAMGLGREWSSRGGKPKTPESE